MEVLIMFFDPGGHSPMLSNGYSDFGALGDIDPGSGGNTPAIVSLT
ncbi:MAG: hypothetical protein ACK4SL_01375 [Candidatus Paceibacteria bacterium]